MSSVNNAIILAAGRGYQLDGVNKVLIRHPKTGLTVLDHAIKAFAGKNITVVVGFRAIQIMEKYPQLNYVINHDWAITNNAMSLGIALAGKPAYVISGDIFINQPLIEYMDASPPDAVLTQLRENRTLSAIHCILKADNSVAEMYQGAIKDVKHPEAIGLFKISNREILSKWKALSVKHGNLFVGQTLPCDIAPLASIPVNEHPFIEINTPSDYWRFIQETRKDD